MKESTKEFIERVNADNGFRMSLVTTTNAPLRAVFFPKITSTIFSSEWVKEHKYKPTACIPRSVNTLWGPLRSTETVEVVVSLDEGLPPVTLRGYVSDKLNRDSLDVFVGKDMFEALLDDEDEEEDKDEGEDKDEDEDKDKEEDKEKDEGVASPK